MAGTIGGGPYAARGGGKWHRRSFDELCLLANSKHDVMAKLHLVANAIARSGGIAGVKAIAGTGALSARCGSLVIGRARTSRCQKRETAAEACFD